MREGVAMEYYLRRKAEINRVAIVKIELQWSIKKNENENYSFRSMKFKEATEMTYIFQGSKCFETNRFNFCGYREGLVINSFLT